MVQQVTRPNALFLSAAAQHGHEQLAEIYRWFQSMRTMNVNRGRHGIYEDPQQRGFERWLQQTFDAESSLRQISLLDDEPAVDDPLDSVRELVRSADVGIVDIELEYRDEYPDARFTDAGHRA